MSVGVPMLRSAAYRTGRSRTSGEICLTCSRLNPLRDLGLLEMRVDSVS